MRSFCQVIVPALLIAAFSACALGFYNSFPFYFESSIGEDVVFPIDSVPDEYTFGANGLPYGLTIDADTGVVSGIPIQVGTFRANFQKKHVSGSIDTKGVRWTVRREGEISKRHHLSQVLEVEVGEDLSLWRIGFVSDDTVGVYDLPEEISFDVAHDHFVGSFSEPGIYEATVVQRQVGTLVEIKFSFIVKPAVGAQKFKFEGFVPDDSGVIFFNGRYYFGDRASIWESGEALEEWSPLVFQLGKFAHDVEVFKNKLLIASEGGIFETEDGIQFDLRTLDDIWRVRDLWSGNHGVIARAEMEFTSDQKYFFSENGEDWSRIFPPGRFGNVFEYKGEFYFPDGDRFHVTAKGEDWRELEVQTTLPEFQLSRCVSGAGIILTLAEDGYYYSENASEWAFKELPGSVSWFDINYSGGKFFILGSEGGDPYYAPQQILTSSNGLDYSLLELRPDTWRVDKVSLLNDKLFIASLPVAGRLEVSVLGLSDNTFVSLPETIVAYRGTYFPVEVVGDFDTVYALGLPEGLYMDEKKGVIYGDPVQEYSEREVSFVPVLNGEFGTVSKTQLVSSNIDGRPTIYDQFIIGEIGRDLYSEKVSGGPDLGPEDNSLRRWVEGIPLWMTYDAERNSLRGRPEEPMVGVVTFHVSNAYGSESKGVPVIVPDSHAQEVIDMEWFHHVLIGESVSIQISKAPIITRFEVYNLPDGMSFDAGSGFLSGSPTKLGYHTVIIVPFQSDIIHKPFLLTISVGDKVEWPRFKETTYFIRQDSGFNVDIEIPEYNYSGWKLVSDDLPEGLQIEELRIIGEAEVGVHEFSLSLVSSEGQVIETKLITLYVASNSLGTNIDRYFHMNGRRGIPLTESLLVDAPFEVSGVSGLPDGLEYNASKYQISGVPLETGDFILQIDLRDSEEKWYAQLRIEEYFEVTVLSGFYDSTEERYIYEIQGLDANDVSIDWLYDGEPITADENVPEVNSSELRIKDLAGYNPDLFQVKLGRNGDSETFDASYDVSSNDFQRWLTIAQVDPNEPDPMEEIFHSGFSPLFLFAQGVDSLEVFDRPQVYLSGDTARLRFKTDQFWKREELTVLVYDEFEGTPIALLPEFVGVEGELSVWEVSVSIANNERLFFELQLELDE